MEKENRKRLAVLVGCNYENTKYKLHGCHNDVLTMKETLITRFGFDANNIELLTDRPDSPVMPTGANIKAALTRMADRAEAGDVLFFHFSGHGTLVGKQGLCFKQEEAIVPLDFNLITSVDMRHIINRVATGATFTVLSDSCHSGGLIDKEKEQIGPSNSDHSSDHSTETTTSSVSSCGNNPKFIPFQSLLQHLTSLTNINTSDIGTHMLQLFGSDASFRFRLSLIDLDLWKPLNSDEGILLSGCQANESSADMVQEGGRKAYGAFSNAVENVLKEHSSALRNKEIVLRARKLLERMNFPQHPCLYCSDENADAIFLCQDAAV